MRRPMDRNKEVHTITFATHLQNKFDNFDFKTTTIISKKKINLFYIPLF